MAAVSTCVFMPGLAAAQSVKVGIVGPFSGPFAHYGTLFKAGAEAYVESQGRKLASKTVELISPMHRPCRGRGGDRSIDRT